MNPWSPEDLGSIIHRSTGTMVGAGPGVPLVH